MYTKEQLQDAIIFATRSTLKLYSSKEEIEKALNELADDDVKQIVMAAVIAAIKCKELIDLVKLIKED